MKTTKIEVRVRHNGNSYFGWFRYGEHTNEPYADSITKLNEQIKRECKKYCGLDEVVIEHTYDITAIFQKFDFINKSAFAKFIDLNPSLIRQYAVGLKHPSKKQVNKILNGFFSMASEMNRIALAVDGKTLLGDD